MSSNQRILAFDRFWRPAVLAVVGAMMGQAAIARPSTQPATRPVDHKLEAEIAGLERLDFRHVIANAKDKVFPAVVFIKVVSESYEGGRKVTQEAAGSGVLISASGELLTNWHVIDKAVEVRCLLSDGTFYDARVVGSDKDVDVALVQLKLPPDAPALPFAALGDSDKLTEGSFVMAMGAPWGLSRSVSMGIISCSRRFLPATSEYSLWLQTDASISPGNSGGPLVNTEGKVIGINTRGMTQGGDMGFAIPSNTLAQLIGQIRTAGKVNWSWTGLQLQPLKDFNKNIVFEGTEGVMVGDTDPESPARRAGIQSRDRILRVNGDAMNALTDDDLPTMRRMLGLLPKEKPAHVELLRDGKPMAIDITPRDKGKVQGEELDCPRWDLTVKTINQFDNPDLFFHREKGVFVFGIKSPGNALASGLQPQDILLKVDGHDINTLEDVKAVHASSLQNIDDKHRMVFSVLRNGRLNQVVLDFARDYSRE